MTFEAWEVESFTPSVETSNAARARFQLVSAAQMRAEPEPIPAVRGIFPAHGIAAIYGPSGSGKSFLTIDLMAPMAEAGRWFGCGITRPHRVVALVLEGETGFRRRVRAWETARGRSFSDRVRFCFEAFNLLDGKDLGDLAASIETHGGCDVLFIDTLNRSMPGADENSARDASTIVANLGWLQRSLGCLVVVVHHSGKDETRGMRGHSSLHAAMDTVISVTRTPNCRQWELVKSKDDIDGTIHPFTLETVELGEDFMGSPVTSCVVRAIDEPVDTRPRPPTSKNQRIVYDALGPLFGASTTLSKASAPPGRPCLVLEDVILEIKDRVPAEPRRQATRAREAITGMISTGILGFDEGWIWLK